MCGIVCQVGHISEAEILQKALDSLSHRGPDSQGMWLAESHLAWLGHRRLSIVDLSEAGNQPMTGEDGQIWLVCNGEIYNYPTLKSTLEALGHVFHSNSDSEAIIHAYEQWGERAVEQLEGMFAFALWDERRHKLLAARDRIGIKPLLYHESSEGGLVLASEASALLPFLPDKAVDPLALAYAMTLGYIPAPHSIWRGIRKLEPGRYMTWEPDKGLSIKRYWAPPDRLSEGDGLWEEIFEKVLAEHLLSDVPIGLFLSGGLDSTSVAAGLHNLDVTVTAITVGFPGSEFDETPVAAQVASHMGHIHKSVPLEVDDVWGLIEKVADAFDEPQTYSALLSMYLVSQVAAEDFKVVLAGDGGDEVFGGYSWYNRLDDNFPLRRRVARKLLRPLVRMGAPPAVRKRAAAYFASSSLLHRHAWRLHPRFLPEEAEAILSPTGLRFSDEEMLEPLRKHYEPTLPARRALQRVDLMTFCTDSILAKVDRASMAHSLEVRVPFLDRRVIEWGLSRPPDPREAEQSKVILRDYLKSRAPHEVLEHPKQGFSLRVLDDFDWDAAVDRIAVSPWVNEGYWSPTEWRKATLPGVPHRTGRIWALLMLAVWAEKWLDN